MKNIAQRTKDLRLALGGGKKPISQHELGLRIRYSRTYISMVEREEQADPGEDYVSRIAALEEHGTPNSAQELAHYNSTQRGEPQSMSPPPHHVLPPLNPGRDDAPLVPLSQNEYIQAVNWLGHLFAHDESAARLALITIKGLFDMSSKKKK